MGCIVKRGFSGIPKYLYIDGYDSVERGKQCYSERGGNCWSGGSDQIKRIGILYICRGLVLDRRMETAPTIRGMEAEEVGTDAAEVGRCGGESYSLSIASIFYYCQHHY